MPNGLAWVLAHPSHSHLRMALGTRNLKPASFFTPLEYEVKSIFLSLELLMGLKSYALGLWAQICSYNTETHKPIAF